MRFDIKFTNVCGGRRRGSQWVLGGVWAWREACVLAGGPKDQSVLRVCFGESVRGSARTWKTVRAGGLRVSTQDSGINPEGLAGGQGNDLGTRSQRGVEGGEIRPSQRRPGACSRGRRWRSRERGEGGRASRGEEN